MPFPPFVPGVFFMFFAVFMFLLQLAWYVAVIVFLVKIWQRVKHLPG